MIKTGKKFSKPEMSRVINGDVTLPEVETGPEKIRLDVLMTEIYRSYNRSTLQKFIELGFVTVDGEIAKKPNQKVERTVKIDLKIPKVQKNADVEPKVIYEDSEVIVYRLKQNDRYNAGNLVKIAAVITGGNGGGKPDIAQAGGKDISKLEEAINAVKKELL